VSGKFSPGSIPGLVSLRSPPDHIYPGFSSEFACTLSTFGIESANFGVRFVLCSDRMISAMNSSAVRGDWVGRVIGGNFTLLEWLGGSEQSGVFVTEIPGDQPQKAIIKFIPAEAADAEARLAGWTAAADLSHPHLMQLYCCGHCQIDDSALIFAVTEYADEVLSQILPQRALTPDETREMLDPVIDALAYLHSARLVHGHLKPSNILVVGDQLKISVDNLYVAGTPGSQHAEFSVYDAPETAIGAISTPADIWSLGATLVEALTQRPPIWDSSTDTDPTVPKSIPQPFEEIARECLFSEPALRCTLDDVKALLDPERLHREPAGTVAKRPSSNLGTIVVIAVSLILIVFFAVIKMRSHDTQPSAPPPDPQQVPAQQQASAATTGPSKAQQQSPPTVAPQPKQQEPAAPAQAPIPQNSAPQGAAVPGQVAQRVMPDALPAAIKSIQGTVNVRVQVQVDSSGAVSNASFDSAGPSRYFAKVALQAAQQWKFKPAQVDGRSVPSEWMLHFQFTRDGADVTPTESTP
jgi:TonB family protein